MSLTWQIDNYPGFENGIDGSSLAEKMQKQAEKFGAKSEYAEVFNMDLTGKLKRVETSSGIYIGKTVVIATGANPRELGLAKEKELIGHGVAYCASCDGHKEVIDAGDTSDALYYEVCDMEKAVSSASSDEIENLIHSQYTYDVMKIMSDIRTEWDMKYPEEE